MKILAVDAGNSRVKWGLQRDGEWAAGGAVATTGLEGLDGAWAGLAAPDAIVVANVAGAAARRRLEGLLARWPAPPRWVQAQSAQCGVRNGYADPGQLGCDRWAALVGARSLTRDACLVVMAGTAVTVDALAADGAFLGGIIVPGPRLMQQALADNTAALGLEQGRYETFPRCTADGIQSGAAQAVAGAVERMARELERAAGNAPGCLLSGGAAQWLAPRLERAATVVDNLVLEGLAVIARAPS